MRRFPAHILVAFSLWLTGVSSAQVNGRISGTTVDAQTGDPLVGATIVLEGTNYGTICDLDGHFQIFNVPPGTYTVIVSDLNYCTATRDTTIGEPEVLEVTIDSISTLSYNGQMISCFGESDAILGAIMDGGTRPYDFRWEFYQNGWVQISVDSILNNRPSGLHRVTMEDVNGCVDTVEIFITQPERLSSQTFVTEAACNNTPTGGIDLHMAGGTPGYIYSWSNNEVTSEIQNLLSGNYTVTVDGNASETINGSLTLVISSQYDSFELGCDGSNWYIR